MSTLDLIDWRLVGFSALWLLGLATLLATFSFADYTAQASQTRTRQVLGRPSYQLALNTSLVLFCLGLSGSSRAWWETGLWIGLALAFGYQAGAAWRAQRRAPRAANPPPAA